MAPSRGSSALPIVYHRAMIPCPKCGASVQPPPGPSAQCPSCRNYFPVNGTQTQPPQPYGQPPPQQYGQPPPQYPPQPDSQEAPRVIVVHHGLGGYSSYWMIRLGIVAVFVLMSGAGWVYHRITGSSATAGVGAGIGLDDDWDGKQPLTCDENDQVEVDGVKATFSAGAAIIASGNCHLTCKDCTLKAPFAVQASGNAKVVLVNGSAEGTDTSLSATENAIIDVRGNAKVIGPTKQSGNAKVSGVTAVIGFAISLCFFLNRILPERDDLTEH